MNAIYAIIDWMKILPVSMLLFATVRASPFRCEVCEGISKQGSQLETHQEKHECWLGSENEYSKHNSEDTHCGQRPGRSDYQEIVRKTPQQIKN